MKHVKLSKYIYIFILVCVYIINVNKISAAENEVISLSGSASTCNVYAKPNGTEKLTYIVQTYRDAPILGYQNGYYRIMISGVDGWISSSCVYGKRTVSKIPNFKFTTGGVTLDGLDVSRYQVIGNKMYFAFVYGKLTSDPISGTTITAGYTDVPKGLKDRTVYYSYDGIYYYLNYNTMINDYKAGHRNNSANVSNPYYDYYQYLPMRTNTKITNTAFNDFLKSRVSNAGAQFSESKTFNRSCAKLPDLKSNYNGYFSALYNQGDTYIKAQSANNVNAGLLYGITLTESANGTSNLSRHYKNFFGWNATDSCPNGATVYSNAYDAINKYFSNMSNNYANPINYGGMGSNLGNKQSGANVSYASDPYWGYKNAYNYRLLDEKAKSVDKNTYKIGIIKSGKVAVNGAVSNEYVNVYQSASTTSTRLYYYERNNASVLVLGESGNFYKIANETKPNAGYAYIEKAKVYIINTPVTPPPSTNNTNPEVITSSLIKNSNNQVIEEKYTSNKSGWLYSNKFYYNSNNTIARAERLEKTNLVSVEYFYKVDTYFGQGHGSRIVATNNFYYNSNKTIAKCLRYDVATKRYTTEYFYKNNTVWDNHGSMIVSYNLFTYNSKNNVTYALRYETATKRYTNEYYYTNDATWSNHGSKIVSVNNFYYNNVNHIIKATKTVNGKVKATYYYKANTVWNGHGSRITKVIYS